MQGPTQYGGYTVGRLGDKVAGWVAWWLGGWVAGRLEPPPPPPPTPSPPTDRNTPCGGIL